MYDALVAVQAEMGGESAMEIVYSEGMFVVDDAAAAIRDYASEGYNLVIAHGSQYGSSLQEIAPDFPETMPLPGALPLTPSLTKESPTSSLTKPLPRKVVMSMA